MSMWTAEEKDEALQQRLHCAHPPRRTCGLPAVSAVGSMTDGSPGGVNVEAARSLTDVQTGAGVVDGRSDRRSVPESCARVGVLGVIMAGRVSALSLAAAVLVCKQFRKGRRSSSSERLPTLQSAWLAAALYLSGTILCPGMKNLRSGGTLGRHVMDTAQALFDPCMARKRPYAARGVALTA